MRTLPAGTTLVRVHHARFAPVEFDAPRRLPYGRPVTPTLYAALDADTAIAEALFHDVPEGSDLPRAALRDRRISRLSMPRALRLIAVDDRALLDAPASAYGSTADAAEALHDATPEADGIVWASRRFADQDAIVLFGDRVHFLHHVDGPLALDHGPGLDLAERVAMRAGVGLLF
ncbi:RES family NAD+ phosphorylase [Solirubrobacter soli]|uniref:RES family NAD+ phosphorylase n=1 Tax=Solirubrobacter soli TaxID=363832 RepID=UPI0004156EAC|nr:RES family NAD+ phosphorylase [Solirubrobacter soli]